MAKPALGKGLGELLNENGASRATPETRTISATPALSAGMSTLVRNSGEAQSQPAASVSPKVLRISLLAADAVLLGGAVLLVVNRTSGDWKSVTIALLAVLFGAWLGWLALNLGREKPQP